jgi:peptidoglycan/LPS O-acetylase OafA/YrhL
MALFRPFRSAPAGTDSRGRLPYVSALDGVRAFAIAGVVLYHAGVRWVPGGFLGVDVFFVLSGYLITSLLLSERLKSGANNLREFWGRRARRLLPAAFLLIAVCVVVVAAAYPLDVPRTRGDAISSIFYVNNWYQIVDQQSYFASFARPSPLQHLWSLSIEEQFYVLWPFALMLGLARAGRTWTAWAVFAAALCSGLLMALLYHPGDDPTRVYFGTGTHASGLLFGSALAFAWPLGGQWSTPHRGAAYVLDAVAIASFGVVVWAMATWHDFDPFVYQGGIVIVGAAVAVMLAAVTHPASLMGRAFGVPPLRWIGKRSYGIYLWHWPVIVFTRPGIDLTWNRWLLIPAQIAAAVGLAALSYRFVEQPIRSGKTWQVTKAWLDRCAPRARLIVGVALLSMLAGFTVWIAGAGAARPKPRPAELRTAAAVSSPAALAPSQAAASKKPALAVGSSVMLAAQDALGRHAIVDAAVGRQPHDIIERLEKYRKAHKLPDTVVVQMGENGPVFGNDIYDLREVLRGVDHVVLVNVRTPRSWNDESNHLIAEAVSAWPQARLADWYDTSARHGLLYKDKTHPNARGQRAYARMVERALG